VSLLSDVATLSLKIAESGLTLSETAFRTAQDALDKLTGSDAQPTSGAPVLGPRNLDQALSELANRTGPHFLLHPPSTEAFPARWNTG
jgi:hypothetical protein